MTIYVDDAQIRAKVGRIDDTWSHLTADTQEELHTFADTLGLARSWFQVHHDNPLCPDAQQCPHWHYDVTSSKRQRALELGAKPIERRELAELIAARRAAFRAGTSGPTPTAVQPAPVRRPAGRGGGLEGPACPERADRDQGTGNVHQAMCVRCGRVTARRDTDGLAWCGGDIPARPAASPPLHEPPTAERAGHQRAGKRRAARYNPKLKRHSWTKLREHHRRCGFCGIHVVNNRSSDHRTWWQTWTWPNGETGTNEDDSSGRVPPCPGPSDPESAGCSTSTTSS